MLALLTGEEPEGTHKKSEVHFTQLCLQSDTSMACTEKLLAQYVFLSAQSLSDYGHSVCPSYANMGVLNLPISGQ